MKQDPNQKKTDMYTVSIIEKGKIIKLSESNSLDIAKSFAERFLSINNEIKQIYISSFNEVMVFDQS